MCFYLSVKSKFNLNKHIAKKNPNLSQCELFQGKFQEFKATNELRDLKQN